MPAGARPQTLAGLHFKAIIAVKFVGVQQPQPQLQPLQPQQPAALQPVACRGAQAMERAGTAAEGRLNSSLLTFKCF